ncbi:putative transmembrane protein [Gregarina niphandrodes]|uniref:Transmembrane protein n=1 Tax=Gregarina niphandrodes TaxID=110365 RepID=A0A023AYX8_GRENI|nr:putative transmembrane protein [Gregarina niphandrodes]EZG43844.1 putative transmembrane protein [Gregarina niphandrodes]|eukprot:XP_011132965.1 putative transmembrane protein [Gregarina niphandrodes]
MKTILRLLTTKVFPRVNPHVPFEEVGILSRLVTDLGEDAPSPVGTIRVRCDQAAAFMAASWKHWGQSRPPERFRWQYVVRTQGRTWVSPVAAFAMDKGSPVRIVWQAADERRGGGGEGNGGAEHASGGGVSAGGVSATGSTDLSFECPLYDLCSDVVVEFYYRIAPPEVGEERAVTEIIFGTRHDRANSGSGDLRRSADFLSRTGYDLSRSGDLLPDAQGEASETEISTDWRLYGHVIVPIPSVMAYSKRKQRQQKRRSDLRRRSDPRGGAEMHAQSTDFRWKASEGSPSTLRRRIRLDTGDKDLFSPNPSSPSYMVVEDNNEDNGEDNDKRTVRRYGERRLEKSRYNLAGWLHVYPVGQQRDEHKYPRPMAGYPGVGMLSPKFSLGCVRIAVQLKLRYKGYMLAYMCNQNKPASIWTLPTTLDVQAFETSGSRLHWASTQLPLWIHCLMPYKHVYRHLYKSVYIKLYDFVCARVSKFNKNAESRRSQVEDENDEEDVVLQGMSSYIQVLFPVVSWVSIWLVTSLMPVALLPVSIFSVMILLSMPYWSLRDIRATGCQFRSVHPEKSRRKYTGEKKRVCPENWIPHAIGIRSSRNKNVSRWMNDYALSLRCPRELVSEQFKQEGYNIAALCEPAAASPPTGAAASAIASLGGLGGAGSNQASQEPPQSGANAVMYPSLIYPGNPFYESSIGSIFGRMDVSVYDPTNNERVFPVFSDDCPPVDVFKMRHLAIVVLEAVQFMFAINACFIEKIQLALNWTDPLLSRLTYIVIGVLAVQATITIWLLSLLPAWVLRTMFIFAPLFSLLLLLDSRFIKDYKLHRKLDQVLLNVSDAMVGSHMVGRVCVDAWDLMYSSGLMSWPERTKRIIELNEKAINRGKSGRVTAGSQKANPCPPSRMGLSKLGGTKSVPAPATTAEQNPGTGKTDWLDTFLGATPKRREEFNAKFSDAFHQARRWLPQIASQGSSGEAEGRSDDPLRRPSQSEAEALRGAESRAADDSRPADIRAADVRGTDRPVESGSLAGGPAGSSLIGCSPKITRASVNARLQSGETQAPVSRLRQICGAIFRYTLGFELKFIIYWLCRLPDRREIEHRQICATQWLSEDMDDLLPPSAIESFDVYVENLYSRIKNSTFLWERTLESESSNGRIDRR